MEISKDCLRHLDDCEISARLNGLKPWRLPTHLRTITLQTTIFFRDFLSVLLQVLRLATEEDEEVDYHVIVKEHLAHKGEEFAYHVKEHLAHEGA